MPLTEPVTIDELAVPDAVGAAGWDDFVAMSVVRNTCEAAAIGTDELGYTPAELLPFWHDLEYEPKRVFAARVDGRMVGRVVITTKPDADSRTAWIEVQVLPEFRGRGIGSALHERAREVVIADGRRVLQGWSIVPETPGERLVALTGVGSVPRDDETVRFLRARGYRLEQVERCSRLALPVDDAVFDRAYAEAEAAAGNGYRLHSWAGRTPDEHLADIAHLSTRMGTDAPNAGLDEMDDEWTPERVRAADDEHEHSPRTTLTTAVEHVASARLVGFTELSVPAELDRAVSQEDTLVLIEHRGHRLGMLLKLANLRFLAQAMPGRPAVITFNAEENRPMLNVNEAIGFTPVAAGGAWRLDLEPAVAAS